jgi:glucose/arabinose dehydrogenase
VNIHMTFFRCMSGNLRFRNCLLAAIGVGAMCLSLSACGGGAPSAAPANADVTPQVTTLRSDLSSPWGLAFLPDGSMLVTEKAGRLLRLSRDGATRTEVKGVPVVDASGQGGLLDVAIDPDFASDAWIYFSYAEPGTQVELGKSGTALAKARLVGNALVDLKVIFRQMPKTAGSGHYGSRIVFARDKSIFLTLGERQLGNPAQDLGQTLGKVVRLQRDGSFPVDNPVLGPTALPGIWSTGHRNPQGAALHPQTGELWVSEHGPQGGDEINIARAGRNYGWPVRSYGCPYGSAVGDACRIGGGVHAPLFEEPLTFWQPLSVAPAGLMFYQGAMFPQWRGDLFSGSLAGMALWRIRLEGNTVVGREALFGDLKSRIRDVREAPDGSVILLTDDGKLMRIAAKP